MAEYVRRRRPPPNHPYWQRLHDRAHPPEVVKPVVVWSLIGLGAGLYSGLKEPLSTAESVDWATQIGLGAAGLVFVISAPMFVVNSARHTMYVYSRPVGAALALALCALVFGLVWLAVFSILWIYSWCGDQGPVVGMAIGAAIPGVPAAVGCLARRQAWKQRQRTWPRWESMRARRPRNPVPTFPAPASFSPSAGSSEPPLDVPPRPLNDLDFQ
jgi:hypothetical protein